MKKINTIRYGGKVIGTGAVLLLAIPTALHLLNKALNCTALTVILRVSAVIGAIVEIGFFCLLFIELRQDHIIDRYYQRHPSSLETPQQILDRRRQYKKRGRLMQNDPSRDSQAQPKKSFALPYRGGEIWFEHLDGLQDNAALALEKLAADRQEFLRPSAPGAICFVFDETCVTQTLVDAVSSALISDGRTFRSVCFAGLDRKARKAFQRTLRSGSFALAFADGLEDAKQWLIKSAAPLP